MQGGRALAGCCLKAVLPPRRAAAALTGRLPTPPPLPCRAAVVDAGGQLTTVSAFLSSTYGYSHAFAWPALGLMAAFIVLFRVVSTWAVASLNFSSR